MTDGAAVVERVDGDDRVADDGVVDRSHHDGGVAAVEEGVECGLDRLRPGLPLAPDLPAPVGAQLGGPRSAEGGDDREVCGSGRSCRDVHGDQFWSWRMRLITVARLRWACS